jgi:antirestriction protein ArdC
MVKFILSHQIISLMRSVKKPSARTDVYAIVTNEFISQLEGGVIPWHASFKDAGVPRNLISGLPYSGINVWLLASLGYAENLFLTWKQVNTLGATVKRGEEGHIAVFMTPGKERPVLRYYKLFNVAQCEKIPPERIPGSEGHCNAKGRCKEIVDAMPNPPKIESNGSSLFYNPALDCITMPMHEFFPNEETYYSTLFYGLARSTGHQSRLNRQQCSEMKLLEQQRFNQEEMLSEMVCSYLCSYAGIPGIHLSHFADDYALWLGKLFADDWFIVTASMQAQRAVNYILNISNDGNKQAVLEMPELI